MTATVMTRLTEALTKASAGNSQAAAPAAAVLWTDKDCLWEPALVRLQQALPQLLVLGDYQADRRTGPAIWLKCAIARTVANVPTGTVPVVYLPGVSRTDLRAIEDCPRDLQPLAELQYRGVFWCQSNGKDWTVNAFLSSKAGLGADVAQDRATQEALAQALEAGGLLNRGLEDFKGRQVNAEWLQGLLAPNPTRDLLVWLNEPAPTQQQWSGVRWTVFQSRCRADFGFDPLTDGALVAAEKLAQGQGKWAAVAELYRDSFPSFPKVYEQLSKLQPPQQDLFPNLADLAGYPQANEQREALLRYALYACGAMSAEKARVALQEADKEHGIRRGWLWSRMGHAPLVQALRHLVAVASGAQQLPGGSTPDQLAASYTQSGWNVDAAALHALASVQAKADVDAVSAALRAVYLPWLDDTAKRFQEAVKNSGQLGKRPMQPEPSATGTCSVFVDGLRYDVAVELAARLASLGKVTLEARWTSMPSVTASGKAWCSPVAHLVAGGKSDTEFEPRVAADNKPLSAHNFRKLLSEQGVQYLDQHETGDPASRAWTEAGDLDHYGHAHGIRLARDMATQLRQVEERLLELQQAGWKHLRILTDHGWLLMPGGLPKTELPKHQTETKWGRCAVLKDTSHGTSLTFGWDWCNEVQVAYAPGASNFVAGRDYEHGGLSLQECLVPVISVDTASGVTAGPTVAIESVTWKGLRCIVEVSPHVAGLRVDIRTKPAVADKEPLATIKPVENGKASLAIADADKMGTAVAVVLLSQDGEVIQKLATTIGG